METAAPAFRLLRETKLFTGMRDSTIADCATQFTVVRIGRRQELFHQGDPCSHVYCLLRGCARIARLTEDGSEFTLRVIGLGDLFGEDSLFDDTMFSSTAISLCDGIVAICSAARMRSLLMRYPLLSINFAQYLREDHNRTLQRLQQLSHKPVRDRLLTLLQELAIQCGTGESQCGNYEIKLTHPEIASLIGSTRETVSSELNKLARAGMILRRGRKTLIHLATSDAA